MPDSISVRDRSQAEAASPAAPSNEWSPSGSVSGVACTFPRADVTILWAPE